MNKLNYHEPVLLEPSISALISDPSGVYIDATYGGGGHSRGILESLSLTGRLFAFDQDQEAVKNALEDPRFTLIEANFKDLKRFLKLHGISKVDGILADFGVSSHQFDNGNRGFSTRFDGPLDMRMDQQAEKTAQAVVNAYSMEQLTRLFKYFGEVKGAFRVAEQIVHARKSKPITTTNELVEVVKPLIPKRFLNQTLAQIFQAIRIEVNGELDVIKAFLLQSAEVLKPMGRLVCIAYHSLEDRLVKQFIRQGVFEGEAPQDFYGNRNLPFKKVGQLIVPSQEEIEQNTRARSAKLRIAAKR